MLNLKITNNVTYELLVKVWEKANALPGFDPNKTRQDVAGARIDWGAYGDTDSPFGWEIDHQKPVAKGGSNHLDNLLPLQWENNRSKGDDYPTWTAAVTYKYGYNVHEKRTFIIR